jgi:glutamyl-tRNA synthetase
MEITHVIRGDDHINNTPRQINILKALGGEQPVYGHIPMILGPDGEKLSKRHGAVSVVQYHEEGFLPDAMINYLARLGWSHGDDELFSREQLVDWFDSSNLSKSAAQFDPEKLKWVNAHYMKHAPREVLLADLSSRLEKAGIVAGTQAGIEASTGPKLNEVLDVVLERASTLVQLRNEAALFYRVPEVKADELAPMLAEVGVRAALAEFNEGLGSVEWNVEALNGLVKATIKNHGLKMPKLAMPLRLMLTGITQTPSIDKVMNLLGRQTVQTRIAQGLQS